MSLIFGAKVEWMFLFPFIISDIGLYNIPDMPVSVYFWYFSPGKKCGLYTTFYGGFHIM